MFETGVVRAVSHSVRSGGIIGMSFRFFNMKVCYEYIQYTSFNTKKKITLNYPKSAAMGFCSKGLKKEFETAMVNE